MSDFTALLDNLASITDQNQRLDLDPGILAAHLQPFKDRFLHLLEYKAPNQSSRQQLESLIVVTEKYGEQRLDPEPDKRLALQLSTALNLDEVLCVQYMMDAYNERGSYTAEVAAGIYLEERQAACKCLMRLLSVAVEPVLYPRAEHGPYVEVIHTFINDLLSHKKAGGAPQQPALVSRLIDILRDTTLEVHMHSDLQQVVDEAGLPVSRATLLQLERRLVGKSLLYCLILDQRIGASTTVALVDTTTAVAGKMRPGVAPDVFQSELLAVLQLCLLLALTPQEERGTQEKDLLAALVASTELRNKIFPPGSRPAGTPANAQVPPGSYQAPPTQLAGAYHVLRLCWAILLNSSGSAQTSHTEEARKLMAESVGNATYSYVSKKLLPTLMSIRDDELHHDAVACCCYSLIGQALQADARLDGPMYKAALDRTMHYVRRVGGAVSFSPPAADDPVAKSDSLGGLLSYLAAVWKVCPSLWLDKTLGGYGSAESHGAVESLISRAVQHDSMKTSPEVRIPFFEMMTSLAAGERGVTSVLMQFEFLRRTPHLDLEVLSWRRLITTMVEYITRYTAVLQDANKLQAGQVSGLAREGLMNSLDAGILVASLNLLRRVIDDGKLEEVQGFLQGLERDMAPVLSGLPLQEPFFQLMCQPVPNEVKASLDSVIAAIARRFQGPSGTAGRLLDRLLECSAVAPGGVPGMPRLDLVTQMNDIEARKEEYPETLALMNLLNTLIAANVPSGPASGGNAALMPGVAASISNGGVALQPFTAFVVQHLLAHLWQRGYKDPSQKWALATAGMQHLSLMLELADRSGTLPGGVNDAQAPGWSIMHDLLSSGPTFMAVAHILGSGYEDINSEALSAPTAAGTDPFNTAAAAAAANQHDTTYSIASPGDALSARQAAVLAALRLVNQVLELDQSFVTETAKYMTGPRYQTLEQLLLGSSASGGRYLAGLPAGMPGSGQLVSTLLLYVCYQDSEEIQTEALKFTNEFTGRYPEVVQLLQPGQQDAAADWITLRRGIAVALKESLFGGNAVDDLAAPVLERSSPTVLAVLSNSSGNAPTSAALPDTRAGLILKLLLDNAQSPATPSMTHLLMGYDCQSSMTGIEDSELLPHAEYSCLTVIDRALLHQSCSMSVLKPQLYSAMLCLLYRLTAAPSSGLSMIDYLAPKPTSLITSFSLVLSQPSPPEHNVQEAAAMLHQKSWIMRMAAILLLRIERTDSVQELLAVLVAVAQSDNLATPVRRGMSDSLVMSLLETLVTVKTQEPNLADLPVQIRRLQAEMISDDISVETLLTEPRIQESLGVIISSPTNDTLFDVPRLHELCAVRAQQYLQRSGQAAGAASEALQEAVSATLEYAVRYNGAALLVGGQKSLADAWMHLVEIAFLRQYTALGSVLSEGGPCEAMYEVLIASLQATAIIMASGSSTAQQAVAPPLVNVARILLSKLLDAGVSNVTLGQAADPVARVRTPARCHALLRLLLELLERSQRSYEVRVQLYAALLMYLQFCRGSKLSSCAPIVLQAVLRSQDRSSPALPSFGNANGSDKRDTLAITLFTDPQNAEDGFGNDAEGMAPDSQATAALIASLDAAQDLIEKGNASLINSQGPLLVEVIARDALDTAGPQFQQAIALQLLAALVVAGSASPGNAGSTTTLVASLYQQAVPQALLHILANVSPQLFVNLASKASRRSILALEGQLALLLALAQAGTTQKTRQLSSQALMSSQPIQHLTGCRAFDIEPEEPGSNQSTGARSADTLRSRLRHLVPPVLRLVLSVVAILPDSNSVRQDARLFVNAHYRALERIIRDASSSGAGEWSPAETELEQAELVTSLLSRLVPVWPELGPVTGESLRAALYRLAATFCCLDSKSTSPIIRSLHSNTMSSASNGASKTNNRAALISRASRVAALRAALARFLRDVVAYAPAPASSSAPGNNNGAAYGGAGVPFRCLSGSTRPDLDPITNRPTLLLIRDMAEQACLDAASGLDELEELLTILRSPDSSLDDRTCVQKLLDYGPGTTSQASTSASGNAASGLEAAQNVQILAMAGGLHQRRKMARHHLALAASQLDTLIGRTLFILENSLAVIVLHFIRYLPRALTDLSAPSALGNAGGNGSEALLMAAASWRLQMVEAGSEGHPELLGSSQDLTYLATRLQDTCLHAEELLVSATRLGMAGPGAAAAADGGFQADTASVTSLPGRHAERLQGIDLMVRTVKSYCARL